MTAPRRIARLTMPAGDPFLRLRAAIRDFQRDNQVAMTNAASVATQVSRDAFRSRVTRPARYPVPARRGRQSTSGQFPSYLNWVVAPGPDAGVVFDVGTIDAVAGQYWRVQEIGTDADAHVNPGQRQQWARRTTPTGGGLNNAFGHQTIQVPSQVGRRIPRTYQFHTRGGKFSPPGSRRGEQILPLHSGSFPRARRGAQAASPAQFQGIYKITIKREIEGKHFVRDGARAGYAAYRKDLLAAARAAFPKRP